MNENQKPKRRFRCRSVGPAILTDGPERFDEDEFFIRKQIARTFGMDWRFGHPDIELFYKFSDQPYDHPVLSELWKRVRDGEVFRAGDRFTFKAGLYPQTYTIEFCALEGQEQLLRAVVLELDQRFQRLSHEEALNELVSED